MCVYVCVSVWAPLLAHVYIHVWICVAASGTVERVYLSTPVVAIQGKEANLTVVVWPSHTRTLTFFWWFDNSSEVRALLVHTHCFALHCFPFCHSWNPHCWLQGGNLPNFHTYHSHCDCTWLACAFLKNSARMAGHIYLSRWFCSPQNPLIMQYVKGYM